MPQRPAVKMITPNQEFFYISVMHMAMGMNIILLILSIYLFKSTPNNLLKYYIYYLISALLVMIAKYFTLSFHSGTTSLTEGTYLEYLFATILAIPYSFFCFEGFKVRQGTKGLKWAWWTLLILNFAHLLYTAYAWITHIEKHQENVFGIVLLAMVFLASINLIIHASLQKGKSLFQVFIIIGCAFFITFLLIAAILENHLKIGLTRGMAGFYMAIIGEMLFFGIAIALSVKDKYKEGQELRIIGLQYKLEIEQVINYFAVLINEHATIDNMLWDVTKNCISRLGLQDCVIYLMDPNRAILVQKAAWGPKNLGENTIINPIEIPLGQGIVGSVGQSGMLENISDTTKDDRYILDDTMRFSELAIPILSGKKVIGVLDTEHENKNFYTDRHVQVLSTIAALLSDKIENMTIQHAKREKEMEVLKLENDLSEWKLSALRSQMNPHFIFNAMNSIQQFTYSNDVDSANHYITKFSTLMRKVLNSSQKSLITIDEEVEILKLYLDIENLRMENQLIFKIVVDEELETDAIKLPCMVVQPFIENALKHGLSGINGIKTIDIQFELIDEDILLVTIKDNGIGISNSLMQKAKNINPFQHESKSLNIVENRLKSMRKEAEFKPFIMEDIWESGVIVGTKASIFIPI